MTASCPYCHREIRIAIAPVTAPQDPVLDFDDNLPTARPRPIYRGAGPDRERRWGAAADLPAAPGDRLLIVARSGKTWTATATEALGGAPGGGHLVALAGSDWQPDPEPDSEPVGDPAWMTDTAHDLAPEAET